MMAKSYHFLWANIDRKLPLDTLFLEGNKQVYLFDEDLEGMWISFKKRFEIVEAAGGLVNNKRGAILFIYRNKTWDLPKGKIEDNESREEAALREVKEECGFIALELGAYVGPTYHIYEEVNQAGKEKREILKISYWYEMFSNQKNLVPQLEEGITDLRWMDQQDMDLVFENTYPNILLLYNRYRAVIQ